jgi:hypothetical protein
MVIEIFRIFAGELKLETPDISKIPKFPADLSETRGYFALSGIL